MYPILTCLSLIIFLIIPFHKSVSVWGNLAWAVSSGGLETLIVSVTDNGVVTGGIYGDEIDALLTLLKEPYR